MPRYSSREIFGSGFATRPGAGLHQRAFVAAPIVTPPRPRYVEFGCGFGTVPREVVAALGHELDGPGLIRPTAATRRCALRPRGACRRRRPRHLAAVRVLDANEQDAFHDRFSGDESETKRRRRRTPADRSGQINPQVLQVPRNDGWGQGTNRVHRRAEPAGEHRFRPMTARPRSRRDTLLLRPDERRG